ncbi:hypothetical protein X907_0585 [Glycocaulis alkaliphilus]|uniref:Uncharacterized protein n=1 Tax=Glycocaulis alkaliphilus TaxID=1434191 RepID=A0A3T0E724_9PROT|nr:hypothetical protein [Glycocaulis alkaliphilus]AZU03132.1 hypothetical protein X907_0585 [Glycocaulis alkaliphilus]GGB71254.1 hypothetical protein GCM10007417_08800 [Glycocaulis alkaliphilus]
MSACHLLASLVALAAASGISTPDRSQPDGWWTLRSVRQGAVLHHFVLVEGPSALQRETYEDALVRLCARETHCHIHFWDDPDRAAAGLPLTHDQFEARTGVYLRNGQTGFEELQLTCRLDPAGCR